MKRSISNIAWTAEEDAQMFPLLRALGFDALEIAPTRVISERPYERLAEIRSFKDRLLAEHSLAISSMQSIWYGRPEKIFGTEEERRALLDYTKLAIDFAEAAGCPNLVFGCPRSRALPEGADPEKCIHDIAVPFFRELASYAYDHHTVIAMEPNPPIYHTNFINTTEKALSLIGQVDHPGFLLNLDLGTMIENGEDVRVLAGKEHLIHHVHISEPGLVPIQKRPLHRQLSELLQACGYQGFISIEAGKADTGNPERLKPMMEYVNELFG